MEIGQVAGTQECHPRVNPMLRLLWAHKVTLVIGSVVLVFTTRATPAFDAEKVCAGLLVAVLAHVVVVTAVEIIDGDLLVLLHATALPDRSCVDGRQPMKFLECDPASPLAGIDLAREREA